MLWAREATKAIGCGAKEGRVIVKPGKPAVARSRGVALRSAAARTDEQYSTLFVRQLADQAFSRASGAPLRDGNSVRLLKNAAENYPGLARGDRRGRGASIHFEMYIIHEDDAGAAVRRRADRARPREGVQVRLLYDWMGGFGKTSRRFWNRLRAGGVEVRCYNPPRLDSPLGWLSRDHRKIDRRRRHRGFVTGLCVGQAWVGDPRAGSRSVARHRARGARARPSPIARRPSPKPGRRRASRFRPDEPRCRSSSPPVGRRAARRRHASRTRRALFRIDQLVAAMAREHAVADRRLLRRHDAVRAGAARGGARRRGRPAARAGRVRHSDPAAVLARGLPPAARGRRAGVRVERLDAAREDGGRRRTLGARRLDESQHRELDGQSRARRRRSRTSRSRGSMEDDVPRGPRATRPRSCSTRAIASARRTRRRAVAGHRRQGSGGRVVAGAARIGNTVTAAITNRRVLEPVEAHITMIAGLLLGIFALLAFVFPRGISYPIGVIGAWFSLALLYRGFIFRSRS